MFAVPVRPKTRARHRRPAPAIPSHRRRHLEVGYARYYEGLSTAAAAKRFGLSRRTVAYYSALALTYPEGEILDQYRRSRLTVRQYEMPKRRRAS